MGQRSSCARRPGPRHIEIPHGKPVELPQPPAKADGRWLLLGLASVVGAYWMIQHAKLAPLGESGALAIWRTSDGALLIPQIGFAASAGLGSLMGVRHAFEPDHLAAVSTLLTGERSSTKA